MVGEIVLNKRGIELCRELIRKGCSTKEGAKKIAILMPEFGFETIEDVLVILFSEDAFDENKEH